MYNSEDYKREKSKYSKSELVNVSLGNYLQKRNYTTFQPSEITKAQLQVYASVDNEVSNPNSIEYKSYNCDSVIIDNNFAKFICWLRELTKEDSYLDLETLIGPLFCHLYLDIFQAGLAEEASVFFFNHLSAVEKLNRDKYIQDLISCISEENNVSFLKEEFRSNKYSMQVSENSRRRLMNFVEEECHVTFLQVFQTWFEISVMSNQGNELQCDSVPNECCPNAKFEKILKIAADLENKHNKLVYSVDVSDVIAEINCGFLSRQHGMFGYNQGNIVCIQPLHNFNNLSNTIDSKLVKLNGHSSQLYAVAISRNYLASSSSDGKICIYKVKNFEVVKECLGHIKSVYSLRISSNEFYLASGSEDNTIRLWNLENGQLLRIFVGHEQAVSSLDFHPNCLYLMSGSADKNIRMWNIENGNPLRLFTGSHGTIRELSCHPLGKFIVSGSDDKYVRTWDILNAKVISEIKCRDSFVSKLQWSKDGVLLCAAFSDKIVKVWNFKNFEIGVSKITDVLHTFKCPGTILALEYCFGTFGVLTTKSIP